MSSIVNYKQKYQELKARFMSCVDSAWRDGFENGAQSAQLDQAQQAMAQPAMNPNIQPGDEQTTLEEEQPIQETSAPTSQNPNEDELGQHIEKLESMLGKSEISSFELQDLKKTLNDIRSLQVQISLTKSMNSIKTTRLAKSQAVSFSPKTKANLPAPAQKALSTQQEIVDSIFKKWEGEASKAASDITSIIGIEGLTKKD